MAVSLEDVCVRTGDGDLIGLGVRLGVYLQCGASLVDLTAAIVRKLRGESEADPDSAAQTANTSAQTSLFTVTALLIAITARVAKDDLPDFVFLVSGTLMNLLYLQLRNSMSAASMACARGAKPQVLTLVLQVLVTIFSLGLQLWFWGTGFRTLQQPACGPSQTWFFTSFKAYGGWRIYNLVLLSVVAADLLLSNTVLRGYFKRKAEKESTSERSWENIIFNYSMVVFTYVMHVISAEKIVILNAIDDVRDTFSTGQLLALLLGVFACFKSVYDLAGMFFESGSVLPILPK